MEQLLHKLNIETLSLLIFGISFAISYVIIPKVISINRYKKLMDHPDERSSHLNEIPTLGGIGFFISSIFSLFIIHFYDDVDICFNIIIGLTILFFVGIKDDLMVLSAKSKILAQLLAITFILINPDLYIQNLHGFLGINEISIYFIIPISYFFMIFIINAYNLIDGIDGLAAMLGVLIFSIYAIFFYFVGLNVYFLLSVVTVGFLIAFLRFNLSRKNKIFMGDTGSMILGFLIGMMTLRFLALNVTQFQEVHIKPQNSLLVALSILFFPVIDVIRVILMRLINKKKIFYPDRCHMHHILIDKGITHIKASITLTLSSLFIFFVIFLTNTFLSNLSLSILFLILTLGTFYVLMILDSDKKARKYRKKFKSLFPRSFQKREFRLRKSIIVKMKSLFFRNLL